MGASGASSALLLGAAVAVLVARFLAIAAPFSVPVTAEQNNKRKSGPRPTVCDWQQKTQSNALILYPENRHKTE